MPTSSTGCASGSHFFVDLYVCTHAAVRSVMLASRRSKALIGPTLVEGGWDGHRAVLVTSETGGRCAESSVAVVAMSHRCCSALAMANSPNCGGLARVCRDALPTDAARWLEFMPQSLNAEPNVHGAKLQHSAPWSHNVACSDCDNKHAVLAAVVAHMLASSVTLGKHCREVNVIRPPHHCGLRASATSQPHGRSGRTAVLPQRVQHALGVRCQCICHAHATTGE